MNAADLLKLNFQNEKIFNSKLAQLCIDTANALQQKN